MTRKLVVFGLSISSSWGNGHAIPFRGLCRELAARGWQITFFERDVEWYRSNRDLTHPDYCDLRFYGGDTGDGDDRDAGDDGDADLSVAADALEQADVVLVGSYVPDGARVIDTVLAAQRPVLFYDIDTPITLTALRQDGATEYLRADQIPRFETYLSFTGGPALAELKDVWGAREAEALYCAVDPGLYRPVPVDTRFECLLGYMGTYAPDRQPRLEQLLIETARRRPDDRFLIAGAQYPPMDLPPNVKHEIHLYPREHPAFYCSNFVTLNLTREAMRQYGWSPASRLFEAAACGACIISDSWPGLDHLLQPGTEVLLADTRAELEAHLRALTPERRRAIGEAARGRVLREHTFARRTAQLEAALLRALRAVGARV